MTHKQRLGKYCLDAESARLLNGSEVITLTAKQYETLALIVKAQGRTVLKETFFDVVWHGAYIEEGNLSQTIFMLRKALGKLPDGGEYIETIPRRGYRLSPQALLTDTFPLCEGAEGRQPVPTEPQSEVATPPAGDLNSLVPAALPAASTDGTIIPENIDSQRSQKARLLLTLVLGLITAGALGHGWSSDRPVLLRFAELTSDNLQKPRRAPLMLSRSQLFFTEVLGNQTSLSQVSVDGGAVTRHRPPTAGSYAMTANPRDGSFAFAKPWEGHNDPPLIATFPTGAARSLGSLSGHSAAWSPDGTKLAFTRGRELLVADASGANVRTLAQVNFVPYWPSWSPDGKLIRFTHYEGGAIQTLLEISSSGGRLRSVLPASPHEHHVCCGSWSADGRYFIFVVDKGNSSDLWIKAEHSRWNPLRRGSEWEFAAGPVEFWRSPLFSPDGDQIYAIGEKARGELRVVSPKASQQSTTFPLDISADTITFSHDRKWIAYSLYPEGTLWRSRSDGSDKLQLSAPGVLARHPQWSPDDQTLVFVGSSENHPWTVQQVEARGGAAKTLLADGSNQGSPTFSPDGTHVAFGRWLEFGVPTAPGTSIRIVDLSSGTSETLPKSEGLWNARWSPAGNYLVACTMDRQKLMLYDFRKKSWEELATTSVNDILWSTDGRFIYFDTFDGEESALYRYTLSTHTQQKLADLQGISRTGLFGTHLSLTADNQIAILKQTGVVEIYALGVKLP